MSAVGPTSITPDSETSLVLSGNFLGNLVLDDGMISPPGTIGAFVLKMSTDGQTSVASSGQIWTQTFGSDGFDTVRATIDSSGSILLGVTLFDSIDFVSQHWTSAGDDDILIAKFAPNESPVWSHQIGDPAKQYVSSVAVDSQGALILGGVNAGTVTMPDGTSATAITPTAFAFRWTNLDSLGWLDQYDGASAIAVATANDDVALFFSFTDSMTLRGEALQGAHGRNSALAKVRGGSSIGWQRVFTSKDDGFVPTSMRADATGELVVAGGLFGSVNFGSGEMTAAGMADLAVGKFGR